MNQPGQQQTFPILIRFKKAELMRFIGHLDWLTLQTSLFLKAGMVISQSQGPTKRLKIKTSPPTPVGVASECEITYLQLLENIYPDEATRRLNDYCPDGVECMFCLDGSDYSSKNPFKSIEASEYILNPKSDPVPVMELLEKIKAGDLIDEDPYVLKPMSGRILELENIGDELRVVSPQVEGKALHAAKCASFIQEKLVLEHYPVFTRANFYRLNPTKKKLYQKQ
ncbi:MAG TPA: DUF2344 domain-containing protein [bacterium]